MEGFIVVTAGVIIGILICLILWQESTAAQEKFMIVNKYGYYNENKELIIYDEYKKYYIDVK